MDDAFAYRNQTKLMILHVYQTLLAQANFDDISVSDIVKACGISRTTFYRYFLDKYDLHLQWGRDTFSGFTKQADSYRAVIFRFLESARQEPKRYRNAVTDNHDRLFLALYTKESQDALILLMKEKLGLEVLSKEQLVAVRFFAAGFTQIWIEWLRDGCKESPELMTEEVFANMPPELKKFDYFQ